jgi:hypothetical protein
MSGFNKISGEINTITGYSKHLGSKTKYHFDNRTSTTDYDIENWMNFRVNNTPCRFKGIVSLSDGYRVTVVGKGNGEIDVWVLYNETTKMRSTARANNTIGLYLSCFLSIILFGLAFTNTDQISSFVLLLFFGLLSLFTVLCLYKYNKNTEHALRLLSQK